MARDRILQIYRGTTAQNNAFTGAQGELTMDTDRKEIRIHDGSTAGGNVVGLTPGFIAPFAGSTAPDGWLVCDGSAISRTRYADLFAVIGTTYGEGDGNSTFNLPNYSTDNIMYAPDYNSGTSFSNGGTTTGKGYILFNLRRTRDNTITVKINNTTYTIWGGQATYNSFNQFCVIPVNKGDSFYCNYAPTDLVFYPQKSMPTSNKVIKY